MRCVKLHELRQVVWVMLFACSMLLLEQWCWVAILSDCPDTEWKCGNCSCSGCNWWYEPAFSFLSKAFFAFLWQALKAWKFAGLSYAPHQGVFIKMALTQRGVRGWTWGTWGVNDDPANPFEAWNIAINTGAVKTNESGITFAGCGPHSDPYVKIFSLSTIANRVAWLVWSNHRELLNLDTPHFDQWRQWRIGRDKKSYQ